jgi:hypothetical protein
MALLRSCLKAQRQRNGAAAEDLDFPPACQIIEMFASSGCAEYANLANNLNTRKKHNRGAKTMPHVKSTELCETV